ncbi:MAG: outer membrane lipoprotein carrier protein LolA [Marinicaulis sp.]|nr:outer membrane lipoprotein carrier protein LolA [Marinicaulis sp.]NNE40681.1 outer membrane lipoprotein carrier protein LolA [Marinicaulis sp.]NNL88152.1 outer membrane lipoprotein carrier protein LolA [Marinicaulis sp.]
MIIATLTAASILYVGSAAPIPVIAAQSAVAETATKSQAIATPQDTGSGAAPVEAAAVDFAAENDALDEIEQAVDVDIAPIELAFAGKTDEEVVERLVSALEEVKTLEGDFTQISPSGAVSEGKFYLRRPGFLRFEYKPPTPLLIVANGGMVYVRDEALETTDSYPVGKTPLKFLLRKKIDRDDAKVIGVDRGIDSVAVTFASDEEETEGELTLIVRGEAMELDRWIVRDLQGGSTVVNLENVGYGGKLANRLFEVPEAGGQFLKN